MSESTPKRSSPELLAPVLVLAAALCVLLTHPVGRWFETDLLSLFAPESTELSADVMKTLRNTVTDESRRTTVFVVGTKDAKVDPAIVRDAVAETTETLEESGLFTKAPAPVVRATDALRDKASALLTRERSEWIAKLSRDASGHLTQEGRDALLAQLESGLLNPVAPHWLGRDRDPYGFAGETLFSLFQTFPVREEDGLLRLEGDAPLYLLRYDADALSAESGEGRITALLEETRAAFTEKLRAAGLTPVFHATGVPLFTDAIARNAQTEMNRIAVLSSALVFGMAWLLFGRLRTVLGTVLTVSLGFAVGFAAALAVFGTLHLLTFVFGLTLIGVAVDYSLHWFCAGRAAPVSELLKRRNRLLPSLVMAALSSSAGYAILAATPMTGLKEIAVLAGVGLPATLIFVLTALPRAPFLLPEKDGFAMTALLKVLARLPRLTDAPRLVTIPLLAAVLVFLGTGLANVRTAGGVADLQNAPQVLIEDQRVVQEYLALPSPAQFYTVTGKTLDEALLAEKTLLSKLRGVSGIEATALSDVVPDRATQAERAACFYEALDAAAPLLTELLGAAPEARPFSPVTPEDWIEAGLGARVTPYLLSSEAGYVVTVVRLAGVVPEHLPALSAIVLPNVQFVNLTSVMTDEMNRYRTRIFEGLAAGLAILTLALSLRMGRHTWRAILPPLLGIAAALAVLGHVGQPVTLFTALALVLLLGLGVDYGIFLYHQPDQPRAFAAVLLSGLTSLASFGLLALSTTPALFSFGATVGTGLFVILVMAPLIRRRSDTVQPGTPLTLPAQGGTSC